MKILIVLIAGLSLLGTARADEAAAEIEHLLQAIGSSDCTFVRNGKQHSAEAAEQHLRMKYRRGKRYADTTEHFIDRLATASSWSKKPYMIECPGDDPAPTGIWLHLRLSEYRALDQR
ncbi:MAG: DUF5329 domain-containing protein [Woeseiaceae bacterium]|nr:DUF5329 domain-containing protein [Woeseiaceae bacterium]